MKYTFKYKRVEFGRMVLVCVEIPQIHSEQLDPNPVKVVQEAYDMPNMYIAIAFLTGEKLPLPSCNHEGSGYFKVDVSQQNEEKLRRIA